MHFAIKAEIPDPRAETFVFRAQKTMYGGKRIVAGDEIFVFASEAGGGAGLIAAGIVTAAEAEPPLPGIARQTPRVSVTVRRTTAAARPLGRRELAPFSDWGDGAPQTELNFKFYRQATSKIAGISPATATFLRDWCRAAADVSMPRSADGPAAGPAPTRGSSSVRRPRG